MTQSQEEDYVLFNPNQEEEQEERRLTLSPLPYGDSRTNKYSGRLKKVRKGKKRKGGLDNAVA